MCSNTRWPVVLAGIGDERAREVQRVSRQVDDDLDHVGVLEIRCIRDLVHRRAHRKLGIVQQGLHDLVDHPRVHERLVALDVDDDLHLQAAHHLGHPVGAGVVIRRSEHGLAAEALHGRHDPLVVGGHDDLAEGLRAGRLLVHVLDHRLSQDLLQRLAGQARRCVARRDDSHDSHSGTLLQGSDHALAVQHAHVLDDPLPHLAALGDSCG